MQQAYRARVQLWSDGFYATPKLHWDMRHDERPAVLLFRLRRGGVGSDRRHADRRMEAAARRPPARRRRLDQSGDRHRAGRGRLHPGHGLAHDRGAVVEQGRRADDACAVDVQDSRGQRLPRRLPHEALQEQQRRGHDPRSKATGEPPLLLPFSVFFAIRDAISSVGDYRVHPPLDAPATRRIDPEGDQRRAIGAQPRRPDERLGRRRCRRAWRAGRARSSSASSRRKDRCRGGPARE